MTERNPRWQKITENEVTFSIGCFSHWVNFHQSAVILHEHVVELRYDIGCLKVNKMPHQIEAKFSLSCQPNTCIAYWCRGIFSFHDLYQILPQITTHMILYGLYIVNHISVSSCHNTIIITNHNHNWTHDSFLKPTSTKSMPGPTKPGPVRQKLRSPPRHTNLGQT